MSPDDLARSCLAAGALELAHEGNQGLHGFQRDGVVEGNAHATYGTVTGGADESGAFRLFGELLFDGFVAAGYTEDDIHARARCFLDGTRVVASAGIDGVVEQLGFGFVASFDGSEAALGVHPLHYQADDVDREGRGRVVERALFDVRAVLEQRGEI